MDLTEARYDQDWLRSNLENELHIMKRSGERVPFDRRKIEEAVFKANREVSNPNERLGAFEIEQISKQIMNDAKHAGRDLSVEEIQDKVENALMATGKCDLARLYITYRYKHNLDRNITTLDKKVKGIIDVKVQADGTVHGSNEEVNQENSNKDTKVLSVQRDYIAGEWCREYTNNHMLSEEIRNAHNNGLIHVHDQDYMPQPEHNCFASNTEFVTNEGIRKFSDFHDGDITTVLAKDKTWKSARVRCYGKQKLYDVTMHSGKSKKTISCTRNHRWILQDGTVTTNLQIGDKLIALEDITTSDMNAADMTQHECNMFALGFIIGDGTDIKNGMKVRLCGEKVKYASIFEKAGYLNTETIENDTVYQKTNGLSKKNFINNKIWKYLSPTDKEMLFKGYYAADGSTDRHQISTANNTLVEMISEISAIAGYHIASITESTRDTNFKEDATIYVVNFRIKQNANNLWTIDDITPHRNDNTLQNVWCVEEPETHSFTLNGGVVTGNCCLINLDDMLQNGTCISGTWIDTPKSFSTAATVGSQIIAQVASQQYGGQTITLTHLAPFVDISRKKIYKRLKKEMTDAALTFTEEQLKQIVEKEVRKEVESGCQTIQYQLITLQTTNGQAPFVTVFMYLNETDDPQTKADLALLIEVMLEQRMLGVKNESGAYITPAFPKLIYCLEEDNIHEDSKYWYLTELAAKCTAKRLVPDYISEKKMLELKGDVYPCMGCRSFLTPDRFTDAGIQNIANAGNYKPNTHKYYGRFNQGVVTINLVDVACSSNQNEEDFWEILDERLELCHQALRVKHENLIGTPSDVAPIQWQYGALARLKSGEVIDPLLFNGYSTISLGYAGLADCVYYMKGVSHTSEVGEEFGMRVMQALNDACAKWKKEENIDYSVYGTPLESTTYKFAKCLQRRFGKIPHVTDKNYITNSYHIHVTENISAFDKLTKESKFQKLSPGGAISYVEVPNMQDNIPAVLEIIKHIYNTILYAELNTKADHCSECGYNGEIQIIKKDGKLAWQCPNCGCTDQNKMHVARRTCGYIGTQYWNQGRTQEIAERVLHVSIEDEPKKEQNTP